jgi:hypothetical protein
MIQGLILKTKLQSRKRASNRHATDIVVVVADGPVRSLAQSAAKADLSVKEIRIGHVTGIDFACKRPAIRQTPIETGSQIDAKITAVRISQQVQSDAAAESKIIRNDRFVNDIQIT